MKETESLEYDRLLSMSDDDWCSFLRDKIDVYRKAGSQSVFYIRPYSQPCYCVETSSIEKKVRTNVMMRLKHGWLKDSSSSELNDRIAKKRVSICDTFCSALEANCVVADVKWCDDVATTGTVLRQHSEEMGGAVAHGVKKREKGDAPVELVTLPPWCIAFRDGVYDFKSNKWAYMYDVVSIPETHDKIVVMPEGHRHDFIEWWLDISFRPMFGVGFPLSSMSIPAFIEMMREACKTPEGESFVFELMWNMSHDQKKEFSVDKFRQLAEAMGYLVTPAFIEKFVVVCGAGSNGKNTLFEDMFAGKRLIPGKVSYNMVKLSKMQSTFSLIGSHHNVSFESPSIQLRDMSMLKEMTGSSLQRVNVYGKTEEVDFSMKFLFCTNSQEDMKIPDTTDAVVRRIEVVELWWTYDEGLEYMHEGDKLWYDTTYSRGMLDEDRCISDFCTIAMMGCWSATDGFKKKFTFTKNDFSSSWFGQKAAIKKEYERVPYRVLAEKIKSYANASDVRNQARARDMIRLRGRFMQKLCCSKEFHEDNWYGLYGSEKKSSIADYVDVENIAKTGERRDGKFYVNALETGLEFWVRQDDYMWMCESWSDVGMVTTPSRMRTTMDWCVFGQYATDRSKSGPAYVLVKLAKRDGVVWVEPVKGPRSFVGESTKPLKF